MVAHKRPNFLLIVADDLGFSDVGAFGSEIHTPNLDKLAAQGARFTDFHTAAACSPTRSMLLSGTDNHIAGIGQMAEFKARNPEKFDVPGYEGYLNLDIAALPEILQDAGYNTFMSGKWHLGFSPETNPARRGFEKSFVLVPGVANHYGYEPQFEDQHYVNLFKISPNLYTEDGERKHIEPNITDSPDGFYSSDYFATRLLDFLEQREDTTKPFFSYLPFSAPHWPLQCSKEDRDRYAGVYDDGPDVLREKRLERLHELGLIPRHTVPHPVVAHTPEWETFTEDERRLSARAMETYAGMVTSMDRNIGRVIEYLEKTGEIDNTVIIFMSDNGAEGAALEAAPTMGPNLLKVVNQYYNNSLENIGNHDSYVWYGPRWAQAATAPSRLYKMFSTEGGIRVPLIVKYPGFHKSLQDGAVVNAFATVMDILPTFLELAGTTHPAQGKDKGQFRGRTVVPIRGKSWHDVLVSGKVEGGEAAFHKDDDPAVGWELAGRAALRKGKYKIVHVPVVFGGRKDGKWQLYDLAADPGETKDLSEELPEKYKELLDEWEQYVLDAGVVWGDAKPPVANVQDVKWQDPIEEIKGWMQAENGKLPTA